MIGDLSGIEAFVHTAEERSFRRAAERLGLTPAAISKAVAKLEARLGTQLLERTSRKVTLTPEGTTYLHHARTALDALQAGRDAVEESSRAPRGTVTATVPFILGAPVVRGWPRLLARHPRLDFDLRVTDRFVRMHEENIDVAVRVGELSDSSLIARKLSSPRWVTAGSPAYLAQRGVPRAPSDLAHHECLKFTTPRGGVVAWQFADAQGGAGRMIDTPTRHRIDQGGLLVEAAVAGVGLVQAFDFLVAEHLGAGRLVEVLARESAAGPPIHALCRPRRHRIPKIRVLLDFLVKTLGP